jgi:hypothetical protein
MIEEMAADKDQFRPVQGFNLVGVDDFEVPGKQLYLIGHYSTVAEAREAQERFDRRSNGDPSYIYGPGNQ